MNSISVKLQNWLNHALHEGDGWPHDPLNRAIMLVLIYIGLPGLIVGGIALEINRRTGILWAARDPRRATNLASAI